MDTVVEKIDLKNLDKSNWLSFKFEEIAQKISKTVKPEEAEVDIYVGLEHLDAEDIHIRRKGVPADVKGGKLKCYPGDIIFGKRRAYQRKAAIVDFEGICSAHAFVFRANPEVIHPNLLPFFLHSDQFMHRMVDISVGGLSPTINWGDLKHQEFILPPKDQQAQLAKLLWAMDNVIENNLILLEKLELTERLSLAELFESGKTIKQVPLKELYKNKLKSVNPATFNKDTVYHYSLPSFMENHAPEKVEGGTIKSNKLLIDKDVVLFSKLNPSTPKIWAVTGSSKYDRLGSTEWLPVIPNNDFSVNYVLAFLSSQTFMKRVMRFVQGTSNSHKRVDPKRFYELKIPLLVESDSNNIVNCLLNFRTSKNNVDSTIRNSKSLQKSLINQVFSASAESTAG